MEKTIKPLSEYKGMRYIMPFFLANGLIYGMNALYYSFIPIYLEQICKKNDFERGIILSVGPLVAIVALVFFGIVSDKAKYKNNVLIFIIIVSSALFYCININSSFAYLIVIFSVMMFFLSPFGSLIDAITLEYTTAADVKYGPLRIMGSLIFGVLSLALTFLTQININIIFLTFIFMGILAVLSVKSMPPVRGHAREKKKVSFKEFFSDKAVLTLFFCMFIGHFTFGCYNNFMPNYLIYELKSPQWVWGLTVFFSICGELYFFTKFDFFFRKFSIKTIVVFAIFTQVLRYASFWLLPSSAAVLITSLTTGSFCTILNYAASYYINISVKKEMRATGQTLLYAVSFYIPRFLSGILGGFIMNTFSFNILMSICTALCLMLLFSTFFLVFRQPKPSES